MNTKVIGVLVSTLFLISGCQSSGGGAASDSTSQPTSAPQPSAQPTPGQNPAPAKPSVCVSDPNPKFTNILVDPASVMSVSPLPALAGSATFEGRSYVTVDPQLTGVQIPIYAPTRMVLISSKHYIPNGAPVGYAPDWALTFEVSCEVTLGLAHVKEVVKEIDDVNQGSLDGSSAQVQTKERVTFEAGDLIGYYIKGINSIAFDFIVMNTGIENQFANQPRYTGESNKLLHVVCPWDLFDAPLKSDYYALFGSPGGVPDPKNSIGCGKIEHDVVGTPSGAWFPDADPTTGAKMSGFAIFMAADGWIYIGTQGYWMLRIDPGHSTFKDPASIVTEHCYESNGGYAYVRMNGRDEIQVVRSDSGSCPAVFPQQGYITFYR